LTTDLGGESVAGGKMKSIGTAYWNSPNTGATNASGFSALPGGFRLTDGSFNNLRYSATFWRATEVNANNAWSSRLDYNSSTLGGCWCRDPKGVRAERGRPRRSLPLRAEVAACAFGGGVSLPALHSQASTAAAAARGSRGPAGALARRLQ
jgi:hypothetical protein